ncbi:hypothetical protein MKW94_016460, partial [Papaver nudicaule]|nr:hypothetical protein [Papaver nudicaule]
MNQISRFCVCSRSVLRRNPFTRWSSKPISSSFISNNPTSSIISKFHHTFNYPPQIPLNHFRKFSGKAATAECNFGDDDLEKMISKIHAALSEARDGVEYGYLSPHKAVMIPAREFDAFMKKLGLDNKKAGDYPHHLKRFREKIQLLKEEVDETVAFGEYENYGISSWEVFKASREAGAACKFDYDYLKEEICQVHRAILDARENIQLGPLPPLDAVKIPMDKFKAFMEKFGLDNVQGEDYPLHLLRFRRKIELLKEAVDDIVAFGK